MSLVRKPIYPDLSQLSYKDNNFYEYSPYIIRDNKNIIDKTWWESLTPFCKDLIKKD